MPAEVGKGVEDRLAKLGKEILWLRIAVILALAVLALVAVAVIQLRTPVTELAAAQGTRAAITLRAGRFVLLDTKGNLRGELGVKDDVPGIELFDANGKTVWKAPVAAPEPPPKATPAAEK